MQSQQMCQSITKYVCVHQHLITDSRFHSSSNLSLFNSVALTKVHFFTVVIVIPSGIIRRRLVNISVSYQKQQHHVFLFVFF